MPAYLAWTHAYGRVNAIADIQANRQHLLANPLRSFATLASSGIADVWKTLATDQMFLAVATVCALALITAARHGTHPIRTLTAITAAALCIGLTMGTLALTWNHLPDIPWGQALHVYQQRYLLPLLTLPAYTLNTPPTNPTNSPDGFAVPADA